MKTQHVNLKVNEDFRKQIDLMIDNEEDISLVQNTGYLINGDYDRLKNKPIIEDGTVEGTKTFFEYGLTPLSNTEIEDLLIL